MRVVSLVPSWTETLIEAGVNVVGRSRFCVHPKEKVRSIPAVGGTKHWNWDSVVALKPDLILLDQEENPKFMAEQRQIPVLATHVTSLTTAPGALAQMSMRLGSPALADLARRWDAVATWPGLPRWKVGKNIPGILEWGREPAGVVHNIVYMIWRNPWMTVSDETFTGSVLAKCGFGPYLREWGERYPKVDLAGFPAAETLILFASEPYPFLRKKSVLNPVDHPYAFVDGERFSWFGIRTLRFLEGLMHEDQQTS